MSDIIGFSMIAIVNREKVCRAGSQDVNPTVSIPNQTVLGLYPEV
jgi:hypothetical protein